jgi:hypothetical protein
MSKSMQRIILLTFTGLGLGAFAIYQLIGGPSADHVFIGIAYMITAVVALGTVLKLPSKPAEPSSPVE